MHVARTMTRGNRLAASRQVVLCLALSLGACRERRAPPKPAGPPSAAPSSVSSVSSVPVQVDSRAARVREIIAEELRHVHERKLSVAAPRAEVARLAFGKDRLAVAVADKVVFHGLAGGETISETTIGTVRAVVAGANGQLLALGQTSSLVLGAGAQKPTLFSRVVFFPGSVLLPDLEDPTHFYLFNGSEKQLDRYPIQGDSSTFLITEAHYSVPAEASALGLLRDGALVYALPGAIERSAPRGRKTRFALPAGTPAPWRLLPGKRLDDVFSVSESGEVRHCRLAVGLPELARFQLPATPFAAAAAPDALAFVLVTAPDAGVRHWSLWVSDLAGQERLKADLSAPPADPGEDWQRDLAEDKSLAISGFQPLVAVGGATSLAVWNFENGSRLSQH